MDLFMTHGHQALRLNMQLLVNFPLDVHESINRRQRLGALVALL